MTSIPTTLPTIKPRRHWTFYVRVVIWSVFALLILFFLAAIALVAFGGRGPAAKIGATMASMTTIDSAIASFQQTNGRYPTTLAALIPNHLAWASKDGWKRDFVYTVPGANGKPYDLISNGDDGLPGTADDISVWTMDRFPPP